MATSWTLSADDVRRGMSLLMAVHRDNDPAIRRLTGPWRQLPDALVGRQPMWQVMGQLGETVVATMAQLRDQAVVSDQSVASTHTLDTSRAPSDERRLATAYAQTVREMAQSGGPRQSIAAAQAILRYLSVVGGESTVEYWLRTLRQALLGEPADR